MNITYLIPTKRNNYINSLIKELKYTIDSTVYTNKEIRSIGKIVHSDSVEIVVLTILNPDGVKDIEKRNPGLNVVNSLSIAMGVCGTQQLTNNKSSLVYSFPSKVAFNDAMNKICTQCKPWCVKIKSQDQNATCSTIPIATWKSISKSDSNHPEISDLKFNFKSSS